MLLLIYASSSRSGSMLEVIYKRKQTNQHFEILALRKTVDCKTVLCETRDCETLKCGSWKTRLRDPLNSILREVWLFEGPFTCNSTPNFSSFSSFELHVDQVSKTLLDSLGSLNSKFSLRGRKDWRARVCGRESFIFIVYKWRSRFSNKDDYFGYKNMCAQKQFQGGRSKTISGRPRSLQIPHFKFLLQNHKCAAN